MTHPYFDPAYMKKRKGKKSPAGDLETAVIKWVKLNGNAARRVNTQGQYDEKRGAWRPSGMKRGYEDIDATMKIPVLGGFIGIKVAVEVKVGKDKMSSYQEIRRDELIAVGAYFMIAKDIDTFMEDWNRLKVTIIDAIKA